MPNMSSINATLHATQDLMYALQNLSPENPLAKIENMNKEALRTLAKIFSNAITPEIPLRVPIMEIFQEEHKEVNREISQLKNTSQETTYTNSEPLRVTIVEAYPEELQPVNPAKK